VEEGEEEILPLGDALRLRGVASASIVGPESISTALPQDGQNRAAPDISLPQAGQLIDRRASIPLPASKRGLCSAITPEKRATRRSESRETCQKPPCGKLVRACLRLRAGHERAGSHQLPIELVPTNALVFTIDFHLRRILGPLFLLPAFANLLKVGGGSERLFPQRP
jgi:hypothetical protein